MAAAPDLHPTHRIPDGIAGRRMGGALRPAAAYRLCALYGWTDLTTPTSPPGSPAPSDEFLLNPFGLFFEEITASSLLRVESPRQRHRRLGARHEQGGRSSSTARST